MAGTKAGGEAAAKANKAKYGDDYYAKMGAKGGKAPKTKPHGFLVMSPDRHKEISAKGGASSTRGKWSTAEYKQRVKSYAARHKEQTV